MKKCLSWREIEIGELKNLSLSISRGSNLHVLGKSDSKRDNENRCSLTCRGKDGTGAPGLAVEKTA